MNHYIQTALFISMYINISGLYEAAHFLWVKAIFANGSRSICRLHLHPVAALYGCKIYNVAATLVYNGSNCLHNCPKTVGGFRVEKFNCAMYHKLGCTFMPCGSYYVCTVTLNNATLQ